MTRTLLLSLVAALLAIPASAQDATVSLEDQTTGGQQVVVASASLPSSGYVAIHDGSLLDGNVKGSVVGVSDYLEAGDYEDLVVTLFTDDVPGLSDNADPAYLVSDTTLIAMPHMETNGNETYDFLVSDEDGPFTSGGDPVVDPADVTVMPATVSFEDQTSGGQQVTVASASLPNGGYVAIHDASLLDGNVKGSVVGVSDYLEPGDYEDVTVTLFGSDVPGLEDNADPARLVSDTTLIAMPHLETNGNETYNFLESSNDGPYLGADGMAVVDPADVTLMASTVTFDDQASDGETVTIASVSLPDGGFVAIHDPSLLDGNVLGSVIGVSDYFEPGDYEDVSVVLYDVPGMEGMETMLPAGDTTLIAMPHLDTNDNDTYDFLVSEGAEDGPYLTEDGDAVVDDAMISVMGVAVEDESGTPTELTLRANAPNPVADRTTVRFGVPGATTVSVDVFDVAGRTVASLSERAVTAGWHEATIDASGLASGVYVYRVRTGDETASGRMLVVR